MTEHRHTWLGERVDGAERLLVRHTLTVATTDPQQLGDWSSQRCELLMKGNRGIVDTAADTAF